MIRLHTVKCQTYNYFQHVLIVIGGANNVTVVTGPAKINHVSANYTKLYFHQFLPFGMWYHISVNFRRKPIKFCSDGRDFIL